MTNTRAVVISYLVFAVLGGLFLESMLRLLWGAAGWPDYQILGENWTLTSFIGFGVSFATAIFAYMRPQTRQVSEEVVAELRKVSWPSMAETKASTVAVVVTTVIVAIILGIFDFAWAEVTKVIYEAPRYLG